MHIRLELPRARLRRWHLWLIEHLSNNEAHKVSVVFREGEPRPATALTLLLTLEALTMANAAQTGCAVVTPDDILTVSDGTSDLPPHVVVRLGATGDAVGDAQSLTLIFDNQPHEDALWLALLNRRAPTLRLFERASDGQTMNAKHLSARPGLEAPHLISQSADAVFSRAIELISGRVAELAEGKINATVSIGQQTSKVTPDAPQAAQAGRFYQSTAQFFARRVGDKSRALLNRTTKTAPQWSVAWRPRRSLAPNVSTTLNVHDFHGLPDDGARYYADPFCLEKDGRTHVFVEEFPYATEQGLISAFTIDANGHCTTPRPVLETNVHLSYPQVFEHAGDIFMLPEASASGGLDLYRADAFPNSWVHDTRLIDEPLHDATLHFDGTRWWLFAATQFLKSSSWCALKIYTADDLRGPWQAISVTPVKVDPRSARPAGSLIRHGGSLWRPVQNCATGYGHSLTWCQVEALTPEHYCEQAVGSMQFAFSSSCLGPHTWTATGTIETIDLFAAPSARPRTHPPNTSKVT